MAYLLFVFALQVHRTINVLFFYPEILCEIDPFKQCRLETFQKTLKDNLFEVPGRKFWAHKGVVFVFLVEWVLDGCRFDCLDIRID